MEPGAGLQPPAGGEEQVQWTEVVQERTGAPGELRVYTVAAQTDTAGLVYLAVSVARAWWRRAGAGRLSRVRGGAGGRPRPSASGDLARSLRPGVADGGRTGAAQLPRGLPRRAGGRPDEHRARIAADAGAEPGSGAAPGLVARRRAGAQRDRAGPGRAAAPATRSPTTSTSPAWPAAGRSPRSRWTPTRDTAT